MKKTVDQVLPAAGLEKSNGIAANLATAQEPVDWPEDLLALAEQQQLRHCLEPMLKATRDIFPTARSIKVYAETDFQNPPEKNIIFDVQVPGLRFPQSRDARKAWHEEMFRRCPSPFLYHFLLHLELVSE